MKKNLSIVIFLILILIQPAFLEAKDPVYHSANSILFEIIENGAISKKRVSLEFSANAVEGKTWAECKFSILTINSDTKRIEIDAYHSSTDESTIKNLKLDPDMISFDMIPFSLAPDRPLKLIATRDKKESKSYRASVVGLWTGLFNKRDLIKIEWRQVPSIELPYNIMGQ